MFVKKGDKVRVISGKERGKEGEVIAAFPREGKVIVDGVNFAKKHQKPTRATQQGGIIDKEMPIHVSNVMVLSPVDNKPTRVGHRFGADGKKIRICKRTGGDID